MNALCSFVFDGPTSALLGDAATCTTAGNLLTISLAGDVQIRPNKWVACGTLVGVMSSFCQQVSSSDQSSSYRRAATN